MTASAGQDGPSAGALPYLPRHLGYRQAAGLYTHVPEVAGIHGVGLTQHLLHLMDLRTAPGEPLPQLIPAGAQPAHRQRGVRELLDVHAVSAADAGHNDAPGAGCLETRHHRDEVLRLHLVPAWIRRWLGIADAQLVDVHVADLDSGQRELGEDLPADRGLTDSRRTAQPQDGDQLTAHRLAASSKRGSRTQRTPAQ